MPSAQKVDPATVVRQLAWVSWLQSNLDSRNRGTIRSVAAAIALCDLASVGYEPAVDELSHISRIRAATSTRIDGPVPGRG